MFCCVRGQSGSSDLELHYSARTLVGIADQGIPTIRRVGITVATGHSIEQMIAATLPEAMEWGGSYLRVTINDDPILQDFWQVVKPKAGTQVLIRVVPQGDTLRNVLLIALTVAAISAGQVSAANLLGALGITGTAAAGFPTALASTAISGPVQSNAKVWRDALRSS